MRKLVLSILIFLSLSLPVYAVDKATVTYKFFLDGDSSPFDTCDIEVPFSPGSATINYDPVVPKFSERESVGQGLTDGLIISTGGPTVKSQYVYSLKLTHREVIKGLEPVLITRENPKATVELVYSSTTSDVPVNMEVESKDDRSFIVKAIVWTLNSMSDGLDSLFLANGLAFDNLVYGKEVYVVDAQGHAKLTKSPVAFYLSPDNYFGAFALFFFPVFQNVGVVIVYCFGLWTLMQMLFTSSPYVKALAKRRMWSFLFIIFVITLGLKVFEGLLYFRDTLLHAFSSGYEFTFMSELKKTAHENTAGIWDAVAYMAGVIMQLIWVFLYLGQAMVTALLVALLPITANFAAAEKNNRPFTESLKMCLGQVFTPLLDAFLLTFLVLMSASQAPAVLQCFCLAGILGARTTIRQALGVGGGASELIGLGFGAMLMRGMSMATGKGLGGLMSAASGIKNAHQDRKTARAFENADDLEAGGQSLGAPDTQGLPDMSNDVNAVNGAYDAARGKIPVSDKDLNFDMLRMNDVGLTNSQKALLYRKRARQHLFHSAGSVAAPIGGVVGAVAGMGILAGAGPVGMMAGASIGASAGRVAGYGAGFGAAAATSAGASLARSSIGGVQTELSSDPVGVPPQGSAISTGLPTVVSRGLDIPQEERIRMAKSAVASGYANIRSGKVNDVFGVRGENRHIFDSWIRDSYYNQPRANGKTMADMERERAMQQLSTELKGPFNRPEIIESSAQAKVDDYYNSQYVPRMQNSYIERNYIDQILLGQPIAGVDRPRVMLDPEVTDNGQYLPAFATEEGMKPTKDVLDALKIL